MEHYIHPNLLSAPVKVLLVGAGGTGCRALESLLCLHRALVAKGHPHGLEVMVADPDEVSPANVGRQTFYDVDVGANKASVLVNRVNMALRGSAIWSASPHAIEPSDNLEKFGIVIGAVDNRKARHAILSGMQRRQYGSAYWMDFGNNADVGQFVLGEVDGRFASGRTEPRLPHVGDLFPDLVDPGADSEEDGPSCSLAQALERQHLFVNPSVSIQGMNMLWNLFNDGVTTVHGAFIATKLCQSHPLKVDLGVWKRFGYKPKISKPALRKAA